jgi:hypothetical protein
MDYFSTSVSIFAESGEGLPVPQIEDVSPREQISPAAKYTDYHIRQTSANLIK